MEGEIQTRPLIQKPHHIKVTSYPQEHILKPPNTK